MEYVPVSVETDHKQAVSVGTAGSNDLLANSSSMLASTGSTREGLPD